MIVRLLVFAILAGLVAVPASAQTLPCANPAADPCLISSTVTIPVGVYDIRPKSLTVANKQVTVSGAGELKILAANITFQPGARFIATGTDGNTTVTLDATGVLNLQSQGTSKSKIDVSGNFGGGTINLHSVGNLTVNGTLIANATNLLGFGGPIDLMSDTGNVTVTGDPSEGLRSFGNAQGGGGSITIGAVLGSINVSTQLVPKGGDCGSCSVELTAGTSITTTAQGVLDLRASGVGDGGFVTVTAGTDVNMAGNILANGSSDDMDGGTGGDVLISAGGSITMGGRIELNGAGQDASIDGISVDGDGGSLDISAGTFIQMDGPMFGISKGFGQGDEFSFDAVTDITFGPAASIDMTGDNEGGDITVLADGLITVGARLRTASPIDDMHPAALGATVDVEGCQVNITSTGQLVSTGPGGDPSGSNFVVASTGLTVAGSMLATDVNELDWRTSAPVITGSVIPAPLLVQDINLFCCGVQCPTTTTSTTTTSTSSSTSTSTHAPTTTTSAPIPTTTTSTGIVPTTTSSTSPIPTTTSSTIPTPTTTTSTAAPSTTTSSTAAPTTTTSSTAVPTTTTSSTTSTLATTTSTNAGTTSTSTTSTVAPTSSTVITTSTAPVPTTSTTEPPSGCLDTTTGIDAVRCRLELLTDALDTASPQDLGGANLSHALANNLAKATKFTTDPTTPKRLKKAATQLKKFAAKIGRAVSRGKVNAELGTDLSALATDARSRLLGLGAS